MENMNSALFSKRGAIVKPQSGVEWSAGTSSKIARESTMTTPNLKAGQRRPIFGLIRARRCFRCSCLKHFFTFFTESIKSWSQTHPIQLLVTKGDSRAARESWLAFQNVVLNLWSHSTGLELFI